MISCFNQLLNSVIQFSYYPAGFPAELQTLQTSPEIS